MNPPFSAYVDESMRIQQGLYLMAAVLVAPARAEAHRAALRSLLLRRQPRLHWRDENDKRRAQLVEALAALGLRGLVIVGAGLARRTQERARRKCMERLLWELGHRHVTDVIFERREPTLDARDRDMIEALKGRHAMAPRLLAVWRSPFDEPLLWLPDVVAGARAAAEAGDTRFWAELGEGMTLEYVDAR
ncbi:hypothetical protein HII36_01765 [Nonomuraea sp. NN258]|uniref:hypothetical protein n=1 Tax=Nonomuraea antri TaxID=2730852 RepID=UPI00156983A3|nr:hypothetical protein [Nonomuraea antri]NRQ30574.1 hypothetical protein [Nonomuraea antri]